MQFNRRLALLALIAAFTLPLTGCKSTTTQVTFENHSGVVVDVATSVSKSGTTYSLQQSAIPDGKSFSKEIKMTATKGETLYLQGKITVAGVVYSIPAGQAPVVIGTSNTFEVVGNSESGNMFLDVITNGTPGARVELINESGPSST